MTKLYYTTTSCGAASFIAAHAAKLNIEVEQVDIREGVTASGAKFEDINPKGNVPCLVLDDGTILNEGAATLQWIADQNPGTVAPVAGTTDRYLVIQHLNYIASEVHPNIGSLFYPGQADAVVAAKKAAASEKLQYLTWVLKGKNFLLGDKANIADYYLHIVLSWAQWVGVDLTPFPEMQAYYERVKALPEVVAATAAMAANPATSASA